MSEERREGRIVAVMGATGTGKSLWIRRQLLRPRPARLVIWDFKREHGDLVELTTDDFPTLARAMEAPRFALAYAPAFNPKRRAAEFEYVCRAVYAACACTFVVEELAMVTQPSWAPGPWQAITCTGRDLGITAVGTSQRPAQVDKSFWSNCSLIHSGRLQNAGDVKTMAPVLWVDPEEIRGLAPLAWIERDCLTHTTRRGRLTLPGHSGKASRAR